MEMNNADVPVAFQMPTFTVPHLPPHRRLEHYSLGAILGLNGLPQKLCFELADFSEWCSEPVRLDRLVARICQGPTFGMNGGCAFFI